MATIAPDVQPVAHESLDRTITGLVTVLPVFALAVAVWQAWGGWLRLSDVLVFLIQRRAPPGPGFSRHVSYVIGPRSA